MHIFLDESFNIHNRDKPQFISINGLTTLSVRKVWKRWMEQRRRFVGKRRIHATDPMFNPLRRKVIRWLKNSPDISLVSTIQMVSEIPVGPESPYYRKGKLNFDKVYADLLTSLFDRIQLGSYTEVVITIDNRKAKNGRLGKKKLQEHILAYFSEYHPTTHVTFHIVPSATSVLLEVADFISNTFYKYYAGEDTPALDELKGKTIILKNPLK